MIATEMRSLAPALAQAQACAFLGFSIFPVHGVVNEVCTCAWDHADQPGSVGKHPAMGLTFKNATVDKTVIQGWFAQFPNLNYGIATGMQIPGTDDMIVVIDVDSYKDGADDALQELEANFGKLPETAEVITGGGGRHLYFKAKAGTKFAGKLGHDGIDIKGIGGYVVGPGSRHRNGDLYGWEGSSDPTEGQTIAELPQWVYDKFAKAELAAKPLPAQPVLEVTADELASIQTDLQDIPADDREVWLKVLMGLKNRSDTEPMFCIADQWSSKSSSYVSTGDVRKTWNSLKADGGVTIKTVAFLAGEFRTQDVDLTKYLANVAEKSKASSDEWPEIEPLDAMVPAAPYPVSALPLIMRDAVHEVQDFTQAPLAMVACAAMSALSLAGQGLYDVKRDDGLTGPIGLYVLAIAESGERKSTLDKHFMNSILAYESKRAEDAKPEIKQYNTEAQAWEAKNSGIVEWIKREARENKPTEKAQAALAAHAENKPAPPVVPRLIYGDTTTEALTTGLAKTWPSAGVVSSEGGVVFGGHGMKSDNQMGSLAVLNALWDGNDISIDRRTSQSFTVRGARLTVAIQVQPPTFYAFMKAAQLARGSGFMARFLVAYPESTQGTRMYRHPPAQWPKRDAFCARLADLLNTPAPLADGALQPEMLALALPAMDVWIDFHNRIERQLGKGGTFSDVKDVASKTADNAARVAALFHVVDGGRGEIQAHHMQGAVQVAEWHLCESQRVLATTRRSPEDMDAMELLEWLIARMKRSGVNEISTTEIGQKAPEKFRRKPARAPIMITLARQGYARFKDDKSTVVQVNPKLLS